MVGLAAIGLLLCGRIGGLLAPADEERRGGVRVQVVLDEREQEGALRLTFLIVGRRPWVAFGFWLLFLGAIGFLPGLNINNSRPSASLLTSIAWALGWALWLFILFRRGILAFLAMGATSWLLAAALPTLDFNAWYGSTIVTGLVLFAALSIYGFYRCVAWQGRLAEALVGE